MNVLKLVLLVIVPGVVLIGGGQAIGEEIAFFGFLIWLVITFGTYLFSDNIVLRMCGAELLTPYHSPTLFKAVEQMCRRAELPVPKIYMIPQQAPNICSVGRNPRNAGLVFTEGVLESLAPDELRCAIAHELVHIFRRDTPLAVLAALFAGFLGMSTKTIRDKAFRESGSGAHERKVRLIVFRGIYSLLARLAAGVVQSLVSGKRDFRADEDGAKLTGNPLAMANTIRTMEKKKHVTPMQMVPAVAHLFMVSPLRSGRERIFAAHPSIVWRIERLEALKQSMSSKTFLV